MAVFILPLVALAPASPVDKVNGVIAQKARMSKDYSLRFRIEGRSPSVKPPAETRWIVTYHLWRSGNNLRIDTVEAEHTPRRPEHDSRNRRITCKNCEKEGYGVSTTIVPGSPRVTHLVQFRPLDEYEFDEDGNDIDWRYFGLTNNRKNTYKQLGVAAGFPKYFDQPDVTTSSELRDSVPCLVGRYSKNGREQTVWLSERDGDNPVFFEGRNTLGGVRVHQATEIKWQRIAGNHHYPAMVKHVSVWNGQLHYEETVTVTHADFTNPVDPAVFTLAGFGLNEGQMLALPGLDGADYPRWRNGKIDDSLTERKQIEAARRRNPPPTLEPVADGGGNSAYPSQGNTALVVSIVAGVFSVATLVAAVVYRRRVVA